MLLKLPGIKMFRDSLPKNWWLYVTLFWFCIALINTTFLRIVAPYEVGPIQHFNWFSFFLLVLPRWLLWIIISLTLPFLYGRVINTYFNFILFSLSVVILASAWDGLYRIVYLNAELDFITFWRQFTHNLGKNIIQDFCMFLMTYIGFLVWSSMSRIHLLNDTIDRLEKINAELVDNASSKGQQPSDHTHIGLRINGKTQFIEFSTIDHLRASGAYVEICTQKGRFVVVGNLKGFEEKLNPQEFYRIHRSAIIRKGALESMQSLPNGEYKLITKMGAELRLSRTFKDKVVSLKPD
ncbi:MAG: LytTR family transcriptional regulator [Cyclobacteriaceae bacterium]|nr:LytTR family transcriptional regulator [Cyclobacteriaceae bacterium]